MKAKRYGNGLIIYPELFIDEKAIKIFLENWYSTGMHDKIDLDTWVTRAIENIVKEYCWMLEKKIMIPLPWYIELKKESKENVGNCETLQSLYRTGILGKDPCPKRDSGKKNTEGRNVPKTTSVRKSRRRNQKKS